MIRIISPAVASVGAVLIASVLILSLYQLGPESRHMAMHIASMSVAAPLFAAFIVHRRPGMTATPSFLWSATVLQIVLLWAWHAPVVYNAATNAPLVQSALHATLFVVATAFWVSLLAVAPASRWQGIPALLLTGKLACLLAALLIFAPRTLYSSAGHLAHAAHQAATNGTLDDQHLAGLLMITACPLSYLVAAVIIASQLISSQLAAPARERALR